MFIFINFTYMISFSTQRTPKNKVLKAPFSDRKLKFRKVKISRLK